MTERKGFPAKVLAAIRDNSIIGIRAGSQPHRFIGIWAVVVKGRVFVRSWSLKRRSWYHAFIEEPRGVIQAGDREVKVRAVRTRSERTRDAVTRAYREKYHTPGSVKYVRGMARPSRRATTTELTPYRPRKRAGARA